MDWNFGDFFADAGAKAQAALDQLQQVGVPALEVAAQQWGIDTLTSMQKESQSELNQAVKEVQAGPSTPFGDALKTTIQGTFLETYGLYIVGGVLALILLGVFLKGK